MKVTQETYQISVVADDGTSRLIGQYVWSSAPPQAPIGAYLHGLSEADGKVYAASLQATIEVDV